MSDKPYNAADQQQVKRAQRTDKQRMEQQQADVRALLKLPEFRRYMWRLIGERCELFKSPGSNNGSIQSCNVGRQDVGRELWAEIESVDPLSIPNMMLEHFESLK